MIDIFAEPFKLKSNLAKSLVGGIAFMAVFSSCSLSLYNYSPLSSKKSVDQFNKYYSIRLNSRTAGQAFGAHYWEKNNIIWVGAEGIMSTNIHNGSTRYHDQLPMNFSQPARFLSKEVLAGPNNVYHRDGGVFRHVLGGFTCWHECASSLLGGALILGEYGERIYRYDPGKSRLSLLFKNPEQTRHFHFSTVDPFTDSIYSSLGDSHTHWVTGIMRIDKSGKNWDWIHVARGSLQSNHRQPTAVHFEEDRIIFGSDDPPHGIFAMDRSGKNIRQMFLMDQASKSWFTGIIRTGNSYWAISRSFSQKPEFGVLWWSDTGDSWYPVQYFEDIPYWLRSDKDNRHVSVGFGFASSASKVILYDVPDPKQFIKVVEGQSLDIIPAWKSVLLAISRSYVDVGKSVLRLFVRGVL